MLPVTVGRRDVNTEFPTFFDRLFDRWYRDFLPAETGEVTGAYPVDIREDDDAIHVDAEMPGFKQDEIDVSIDKGVLRITAERETPEASEKETSHLNERRFTRVERAFTLPTPVDEDSVDARLGDGVLHLTLPKTGERKPRRIEVK